MCEIGHVSSNYLHESVEEPEAKEEVEVLREGREESEWGVSRHAEQEDRPPPDAVHQGTPQEARAQAPYNQTTQMYY